MVSQVVAFLRVLSRNSDWTTEEIAELYRIENALVQARLSVQTDRGVTDEGDPWFVFCRSDGEVLVHISRFDGEYRLYTGALNNPLTGRSLMALSKSFVSQIPLQTPLRPGVGTSVYVHPAAMLAVIIGTIFYSWDDLLRASQAEADAKRDGAPDSERNGTKASQQTILSHIEGFLTQRGEAHSHQDTSYFNFITTVAALMVGVGIATNIEVAQDAPPVIEALENAKTPETSESTLVAKRYDDAVAAHKIANNGTGPAAQNFAVEAQQPEQKDVSYPVNRQVDTAAATPQQNLAAVKDVPELMGSASDRPDDGASAARTKMAAADFDSLVSFSARGMAGASASSTDAPHTQSEAANHGAVAHGSSGTLGSEGTIVTGGDWLNLPLKLISEAFSSSWNVKSIVSLDYMPVQLSNLVLQGLSISDNGHALQFFQQHQVELGLKPGLATTATPQPTINNLVSDPVQTTAVADHTATSTPTPNSGSSDIGLMSSLGHSFAMLSSEAFAHLLAVFVKEVSNVEVMVVKDSFVFANAALFDKLEPGAVSVNLMFQDGSSISVVGQAATLLHIVETI